MSWENHLHGQKPTSHLHDEPQLAAAQHHNGPLLEAVHPRIERVDLRPCHTHKLTRTQPMTQANMGRREHASGGGRGRASTACMGSWAHVHARPVTRAVSLVRAFAASTTSHTQRAPPEPTLSRAVRIYLRVSCGQLVLPPALLAKLAPRLQRALLAAAVDGCRDLWHRAGHSVRRCVALRFNLIHLPRFRISHRGLIFTFRRMARYLSTRLNLSFHARKARESSPRFSRATARFSSCCLATLPYLRARKGHVRVCACAHACV
jgi:hypothetical protein